MWFQTISTYVDSRDVSQESLCIKLSTILCWVSTVVYNYIYTYDIHNNQHKSNAGNYVGHQVIHVVCACVCVVLKKCVCQIYSLRWSNTNGLLVNVPQRSPKKFLLVMSHVHFSNCVFFLLVHPHLCCWLNLISRLFWLKEAGTSTEYVEKRIRRIPLIRKQIINK